MTLENARVLYKHRLELGKKVDDILRLYPQLKDEEKVLAPKENPKPEPKEVKSHGKKPKR